MLDPKRQIPSLLLALCLALPAPGAAQQPAQQPEAVPVQPAPSEATTEEQTPDTPSVPPAPSQTLPEPSGAPLPVPPSPGIPGAGPDRIDFQLQFPEDQGGGSAAGSAGSLEYKRDDYAVLTGGVQIRYQDVDLKAREAEIDLDTKVVKARGDVVIDQAQRRLTGETAEYDLDTKTGTLTQATAHVHPDYYFNGAEIAKIDDDVYTVTDGVFTSCSQEVPDWSFRLGTARVEVEEYARIHDASLRAKGVPVFYTPYILWPAKTERSSGFLIPNIGYSDRRGAQLGLAYFQTLGRSYDTTLHLDLYSQNYFGVGDELRYRPSEGTRGQFIGYLVRDPEALVDDDWRWKLEWNHETNDALPWGMRGVVTYQEFSDFDFFRDFERDFDRNTLRFTDSRAFVTGNWGPHLFNALLNDRETFFTDEIRQQRRLPEVEYRLRSTRLGRTPLYLEVESSASYLDIDQRQYSGSYGRVHAAPELSLPVRSFPWLNLKLSGGGQMTFYSDSLDEAGDDFDGEALTRVLPFARAEVVGPSFSRIFDREAGDFSRFKHVIEPRWTYNYQQEFDRDLEIPQFDELDPLGSANQGRLVLANRVLGKPKDPRQGSAREIFLFELSRVYDFDDEVRRAGGRQRFSQEDLLDALVRFNPTFRTSFKAEASYDTEAAGLQATAFTGNLGLSRDDTLGLTWYTRFQPTTGETVSNQIRMSGSLTLMPNRLQIQGQVNYDIEQQLLQQQIYTLNWSAQCYGLRIEMRDFRADQGAIRRRDKDFRFALSLKNVGTFLDLNSRSSSQVEP